MTTDDVCGVRASTLGPCPLPKGHSGIHGSPRALRYVVLAADASKLGRFDTGEEMLTEVVDALGSWVAIADATDSKITGGTLDPKRPHEFMGRGNGIEDRAAWEVVRRWVASNPAAAHVGRVVCATTEAEGIASTDLGSSST